MIDTSAMVAALIASHEHHAIARTHLTPTTRISAIVLAETYAQLRRTFTQSADAAARLLNPWTTVCELILPTTSSTVASVFGRANELDLGGNIHDALIAQACLDQNASLVTLDRRQHQIALALGADCSYLLAG